MFIAPIQEGEIEDIIPIEKILSLVNILDSKICLRIRFHPNTPKNLIRKNLARINNKKKYFKNIDLSISDFNNSFLNELEWCTHLLTFYSTCCIEANDYKKGVCVIGNDSKEIFSEVIDNKRFIWIQNLELGYSEIFSKWLKSSFKEKVISNNEEIDIIEIKNKLKILIK